MSGVAVIRFWCDGCNSTIEVSSELAGIPSTCSKCGEFFLIPKPTPEVQSTEAEPVSEHPQATRANPMWWLAVILGAAAAVASFVIGCKGNFDDFNLLIAGALCVALNPLCWLGLWAFDRVDPNLDRAKCPHCAAWVSLKTWSKVPALGLCKCHCGHTFIKPPA